MSTSSMQLATRDSAIVITLSRGESIGLALDTEAGLISALAASVILIILIQHRHGPRAQDGTWRAMNIYVTALFSAEIIQGFSHAMSMKWVIEGKVATGTFCTAQGALQQLGEVGVALATLTIAVQTFVMLWWLNPPNPICAAISIGIQWLFIIVFVAAGFGVHTHPPKEYYATPTPYWCWLGKGYEAERIAGEYVWFWLTLFVSIILYALLFLLHLGIIQTGDQWYAPRRLNPRYVQGPPRRLNARQQRRLGERDIEGAWTTVLYPCVYFLVIFPLSLVRWIAFKQEEKTGQSHTPPVVTFIVIILFSLSGVFNALLYPLTRPGIFY